MKYYNLNNNKVTILTQNSKLKETSKLNDCKVFNFGISAYKIRYNNKDFVICKNADICIDFCYAQKNAYRYKNTKKAYYNRFLLTLKTDVFIEIMINAILANKVDFLRVHDSGDFYNKTYFYMWLNIAKELKNVNFYAYTNMLNFVRNYKNDIPNNWDFIHSDSGIMSHKIDKNTERHTKIFNSKNQLLKEGYIDASKNDLLATKFLSPNNLKVGLIYH